MESTYTAFYSLDRLPRGFREALGTDGGRAVVPEAAATVALLREAGSSLQILLLKRSSKNRFIPGAYVFPGGRLDTGDGSPEVLRKVRGIDEKTAASRLGATTGGHPALAYYVAAIREAYEESGIPVALTGQDGMPLESKADEELRDLRSSVLTEDITFQDFLAETRSCIDAGQLVYTGHWLTHESVPLRYDTRFFAVRVEGVDEVIPDGQEMVEACWLTPEEALEGNRGSRLPMALPTIRTLEELRSFSSFREVEEAYRERRIPRLLPRPIPEGSGIRFEIAEV